MPKKEVLEMCEKAIQKDLGSVDDLSSELANTVANVYYRYFDHAVDVMKRASKNPGWIPKEMKRETDMLKLQQAFISPLVNCEHTPCVPSLIRTLRRECGRNYAT